MEDASHYMQKPIRDPIIEPITTQDLQIDIRIWMERQVERYTRQWTIANDPRWNIPEHTFVDDMIKHIRTHKEIFGIARAHDEDKNPGQP